MNRDVDPEMVGFCRALPSFVLVETMGDCACEVCVFCTAARLVLTEREGATQ